MRLLLTRLVPPARLSTTLIPPGTAQGRSLSNEKPTQIGRLVMFSIGGSAFRQVVRWSRPEGMGAAYCLPVFDRKAHALYDRRAAVCEGQARYR